MTRPPHPPAPAAGRHGLRCPRCDSTNTKFCYYNNYSLSQPRHFCKACRRHWTHGGALRNIPLGGSSRRIKKPPVAGEISPLAGASPAPEFQLAGAGDFLYPPNITPFTDGIGLGLAAGAGAGGGGVDFSVLGGPPFYYLNYNEDKFYQKNIGVGPSCDVISDVLFGNVFDQSHDHGVVAGCSGNGGGDDVSTKWLFGEGSNNVDGEKSVFENARQSVDGEASPNA